MIQTSDQEFKMHPVIELCDDQSFLKVIGSDFEPFPARYLRMAEEINLDVSLLMAALPAQRKLAWQRNINSALEEARTNSANSAYESSFRKIRNFLSNLRTPRMDSARLRSISENCDSIGNSSKILDFIPEKDGCVRRTTYTNTGSVTGRLTVVSGPNPLTMSADVKSCLLSTRGRMVQLDVASAEPKTALHFGGRSLNGDVYECMSSMVFDGALDRSTSKQATICALYGQSPKNLSKILPEGIKPQDAIDGVRKFFGVDDLVCKIKSTSANGRMRNALGRPVIMPETASMVLSYFLQSSAAEISILLFEKFCEAFVDRLDPIYVIHDALIVDCDSDLAEVLLARGGVKVKHGDWSYELKTTQIGL